MLTVLTCCQLVQTAYGAAQRNNDVTGPVHEAGLVPG
jgi:hypothetical protein